MTPIKWTSLKHARNVYDYLNIKPLEWKPFIKESNDRNGETRKINSDIPFAKFISIKIDLFFYICNIIYIFLFCKNIFCIEDYILSHELLIIKRKKYLHCVLAFCRVWIRFFLFFRKLKMTFCGNIKISNFYITIY